MRKPDSVVDLDDVGSWPPAIRSFAEHWAAALAGTSQYSSDLNLPEAEQASFMTLVGDGSLRAFHSTRLLDEEAEAIRRHGLLPLSEELVTSRIRNAYISGHLTAGERDVLLSGSVFALGNLTGRPGQVCAVIGRAIFDDDPGAVEPLLDVWGGEAIYWVHDHTAVADRLRTLGRPSIVVTNLRPAAQSRPPLFFPPIANLFVGRLLQLPETHGDVHCYGPVSPADIVDIWQPGHPDYDCHDLSGV